MNIPQEERCPTCGAELPSGATECPECGEKIQTTTQETAPPPEETKEETVTETETKAPEEPVAGNQMLFWLGVILAIAGFLGGPLISWAHDQFKWEIIGRNWDYFGWLNITVAVIGIVVGIIGIVMLIMGMKKSAPSGEAPEEKTE